MVEKDITAPEEFPEHDAELVRRGEEAKKAGEKALNAEFVVLKKVGEELNLSLHGINDTDIRNGFPKMNGRLSTLNEQFLNILWGGW
jgi:hypothetical protein